MCRERELINLIKKIKRKKKKLIDDKEDNFHFDLVEGIDNFMHDLKTVREVIYNTNGIEKREQFDKQKHVYNNFEHEIDYYFNEEVKKIMHSSITNKNDKIPKKTDNSILYTVSNIINGNLNYGLLECTKLRNYENNIKYFKPLKFDKKKFLDNQS